MSGLVLAGVFPGLPAIQRHKPRIGALPSAAELNALGNLSRDASDARIRKIRKAANAPGTCIDGRRNPHPALPGNKRCALHVEEDRQRHADYYAKRRAR